MEIKVALRLIVRLIVRVIVRERVCVCVRACLYVCLFFMVPGNTVLMLLPITGTHGSTQASIGVRSTVGLQYFTAVAIFGSTVISTRVMKLSFRKMPFTCLSRAAQACVAAASLTSHSFTKYRRKTGRQI
mgnify:CR=1 FL=1